MIKWLDIFKKAHETSWPPPASLCIQNAKPPNETARNIYQDDKAQILAVAKECGFKCISPSTAKVMSFIKV